jgi:hypothetical protein
VDPEPWELYRIPEFCFKASLTPQRRNDDEPRQHPERLSPNAIFRGIPASSRAQHLLGVHDSMGGALEGELEELELALSSIFHRRLSGRDLELRVQATAADLDEKVPRGRLRICL